ncbi:MAG TPA: hypothetical protein VL574_11805, partial [Stellaceae bacterium]|nr:hypothetical protein [Stellaceae bacterium]
MLPLKIDDRLDDDMSPEFRAILPDAPALAFEAAVGFRYLESGCGQIRLTVDCPVKPGEMLADDLAGRIALEALCAGVPADDNAAGIDHVDGIVGDRLDQKP